MTFAALKEKIAILEKQLLAIDELNNVYQQAISYGNRPIDLECCANLLNHLIDPAIYQVEEVRVLVDEMGKSILGTTAERRPSCS